MLKGSIHKRALEELVHGLGYEVTIIEADSLAKAFSLAANGEVDAVAANHFFGDLHYRQFHLEKTPVIFDGVDMYFVMKHGRHAGFLKRIDFHLQKMKAEPHSLYYQALEKWMEKPLLEVIPRYIFWVITAIVFALLLSILLVWLLRRQVEAKTRNLLEANRVIRESEEKFRTLFEDNPAVKLIINPENGRILDANKAAVAFYGWPEQQLMQMSIREINTLPEVEVKAAMEKAMEQRQMHFFFRHRIANQTIRDVEVFVCRVAIGGRDCLYAIIHDITEQKKMEELFRQAQKMEALGRLAAGVAHDFNNILGVIQGYSELAMDLVKPTDRIHRFLGEIQCATRRSLDIVRQLLSFSRKRVAHPHPENINRIVPGMLHMIRHLIGEDIELRWQPGPEDHLVLVDPSQIEQVLVNLCVNARDAIADIGTITISTGESTLDQEYCQQHPGSSPGDFVWLEVTDNGSGIPEEVLHHIFDPFFTTKEEGKGTGLGLSMIYSIVRQNHGFIQVKSSPGKGTSFTLYFPRHEGNAAEKEGPAEATSAVAANCETVLLLDDDAMMREIAQLLLEKLGYSVLSADTPEEAIRLASENVDSIRLLLTDVVLPRVTCREVVARIRQDSPDLPVLFMSGHSSDTIAQRNLIEPDACFVQKPFTVQQLGAAVRNALGESS